MTVKTPDIRIVNLYRKAIQTPKKTNSSDSEFDTDLWLATDYFDAFEVQEIPPKRLRFGLIEAINAKLPTMQDVAVQSFPLVYNIDDFRNDICSAFGEPFDEDKDIYPFLSIIQVYITPEAIARNEFNDGGEDKATSLLKSYYDDLYDIVKRFHEQNKERLFKFKIYRSLSVGDFAVVICSKEADLSYCISTAMRKRRARLHNAECTPGTKEIVIYKTYTILTMYNSWIQNELETGAVNSRFILRCCYSNKYWSHRSIGDKEIDRYEKHIALKLNRLTGRYDFSVNLTDHRFGALFEDLQRYKLATESKKEAKNQFHDADDKNYDEVDYIHFLIEHEYLSYINERFSFCFADRLETIASVSDISLGEDRAILEYTDSKNMEYLSCVKEKCQQTTRKVRDLPGFHKNLDNNMKLLSRLINICGMLNGLSDMRIYCTLILKYLEVILDNMDHYCKLYEEHSNDDLISHMDVALGSVISIMNAYVDYVRNNNLQSLQTPNYNIESNLSIEKYLIGYTGFIEELLYSYKKTYDFLEKEWSEGGGMQTLVPVVVPQAENANLTVQVFFKRRYHTDKRRIKRLMLVKCPTFSELTNIAEMTATLIHETAHQFRYEQRNKRNAAIMLYIARKAFDRSANEIVKDIHREFPYLPSLERMYWDLNNEMADAYLSIFYPEIFGGSPVFPEEDTREYSLSLLGERMKEDYQTFIKADRYFYDFDIRIRRFLDTIGENIDYSREETQKYFQSVVDFKEKYLRIGEGRRETAEAEYRTLFEETVSAIKSLSEMKDIGDESKRAVNDLLDSLTEMSSLGNHYVNAVIIRKRGDFYKRSYYSICDKFNLPRKDIVNSENSIEMEAARYLGIDFKSDGNMKVFTELMEKRIQSTVLESIELAVNGVLVYRELTADLFMVKLLDLDCFGYLLASVRILPMGEKPLNEYLRRVTLVLFVSRPNKEKSESTDQIWKEVIGKLWGRASMAIYNMLLYFYNEMSAYNNQEKSYEKKHNIWSEAIKRIIKVLQSMKDFGADSGEKADIDKLLKSMEALRDELEVLYPLGKAEFLRDMLTDVTTYCNLLIYIKHLSLYGMRHIRELNLRFKQLEEDLEQGYTAMERMRVVLNSGEIKQHLAAVSAFYNHPYEKNEYFSENSLEMLDFIQRMYYDKKLKTAEEIITYEKK